MSSVENVRRDFATKFRIADQELDLYTLATLLHKSMQTTSHYYPILVSDWLPTGLPVYLNALLHESVSNSPEPQANFLRQDSNFINFVALLENKYQEELVETRKLCAYKADCLWGPYGHKKNEESITVNIKAEAKTNAVAVGNGNRCRVGKPLELGAMQADKLASELVEEEKKENKKDKVGDTMTVMIIQTIRKVCEEHCAEFLLTFQKEAESSSHARCSNLLRLHHEHLENYVLWALETDLIFKAAVKIVNEVAPSVERFAIWKLAMAVYKERVYVVLRHKLRSCIHELFSRERRLQAQVTRARRPRPKFVLPSNFTMEAYLAGELTLPEQENFITVPRICHIREMEELNEYIWDYISMNVDEDNVHNVRRSSFTRNEDLGILNTELCDDTLTLHRELENAEIDADIFERVLRHDNEILQRILPTWMWLPMMKMNNQLLHTKFNEQLLKYVKEFNAAPPTLESSAASSWAAVPTSVYKFLQRQAEVKAAFGAELERFADFAKYLYNVHRDVCLRYKKMEEEMENVGRAFVSDEQIEARNTRLGFPRLQ